MGRETYTRKNGFTLKYKGVKTYDRITQLAGELNSAVEMTAYKYKSADIIREVVNNTKVRSARLDFYSYDNVNRNGPDRYDDEQIVYGTRLTFTIILSKQFVFRGTYFWESNPNPNGMDKDIHTEQFFGDIVFAVDGIDNAINTHTNFSVYNTALINGPFNNKAVNISKYIAPTSVIKYKMLLNKKLRQKMG